MTDLARARRNMVDCQIRPFDVTDRAVLAAMAEVEREKFLPEAAQPFAYLDKSIEVGEGRAMLPPMIFARLLQALTLTGRERALDVACGMGGSTAVLARLTASVVGLESSAALAREASARLSAAGVANARIVAGPLDAPPPDAPFDAILANGAVDTVPQIWIEALANGGRLACIRGAEREQRAVLLTRIGSSIGERILFDAAAPVLAEFRRKQEFAF